MEQHVARPVYYADRLTLEQEIIRRQGMMILMKRMICEPMESLKQGKSDYKREKKNAILHLVLEKVIF